MKATTTRMASAAKMTVYNMAPRHHTEVTRASPPAEDGAEPHRSGVLVDDLAPDHVAATGGWGC
jgi:hypothetical protein